MTVALAIATSVLGSVSSAGNGAIGRQAMSTGPTATQLPRQYDATPGRLSPQKICRPGIEMVRSGTARADVLKDRRPGEILCGQGGDDRIYARYLGTIVYAGPGDDVVDSRQTSGQVANEIYGGAGFDRARVDKWDRLADRIEKRILASTFSPTYADTITQPRVQCAIVTNARGEPERRVWVAPEPQIRAVNATSMIDWQYVAFSSVLSRWNTTERKWEFDAQTPWLWDRTYDQQIKAFSGNNWRKFDPSAERWHYWFSVYGVRTYYRIAVFYYHYASGPVAANRIYAWVDVHEGEFASGDGRNCYFTR
jgi:hypothetical protein